MTSPSLPLKASSTKKEAASIVQDFCRLWLQCTAYEQDLEARDSTKAVITLPPKFAGKEIIGLPLEKLGVAKIVHDQSIFASGHIKGHIKGHIQGHIKGHIEGHINPGSH